MAATKRKPTFQSKFNAAMAKGKSLTIAQVRKIGFANPYDAKYKANRFHGLGVVSMVTTTKKGLTVKYVDMTADVATV